VWCTCVLCMCVCVYTLCVYASVGKMDKKVCKRETRSNRKFSHTNNCIEHTHTHTVHYISSYTRALAAHVTRPLARLPLQRSCQFFVFCKKSTSHFKVCQNIYSSFNYMNLMKMSTCHHVQKHNSFND